MKVLQSKIMEKLLRRGIIKARKIKKPSDGCMVPLFTHKLKNGWYYQVDAVNDSRYNDPYFVSVCAFKPPRVYCAKLAEYILTGMLK